MKIGLFLVGAVAKSLSPYNLYVIIVMGYICNFVKVLGYIKLSNINVNWLHLDEADSARVPI